MTDSDHTMTGSDHDLRDRLTRLEASLPSGEMPVVPPHRGHRRLSLVAAPLLVLALGATTAAAVVITGSARGTPGVENPGQPLHGAALECMSPPQAAAFLAARGYSRVVWQVEAGDIVTKGGANSSAIVSDPPAHGYVVPGSIIDGILYMVIDQRSGATGSGDCFGMPMP